MTILNLSDISFESTELNKAILSKLTFKNALITICILGTIYVLHNFAKFYLHKRKYRHIPGPPTKGLFGYFSGNAFEIFKAIENGNILCDLLVKWNEIYGDVFKIQIFHQIFIVSSNKDAIREALIVKNFPKDMAVMRYVAYPIGVRAVGKGLFTEHDNEIWRQRRAMFNPGFHRHVLMTFIDHFNQITNSVMDKLRTKADGKTVVSILNEMNRATLDAIGLIAFGMNIDSISDENSIINQYLLNILSTTFKHFLDPLLKYSPTKQCEIKKFKGNLKYMRDLGREKVLERLNAYKNNEHIPNDILSSILANYKEGDLDIENMIDDFLTFFAAGQETTANTLAFSFLEVAKNSEIAQKAREEIDRVLGERTEVTYQDVNELKYCTAIFKEALRLYPAAPMLFRRSPEPFNINGYEIPENSLLLFSTYMNCRLEKYVKNPFEFKPERFLKNGDSTDFNFENYIYLPFSLGPRNCIGLNFAQLEGIILIAKFIQKFDFKLDPTQSFAVEQNITLRPKDGAKCFITLRS